MGWLSTQPRAQGTFSCESSGNKSGFFLSSSLPYVGFNFLRMDSSPNSEPMVLMLRTCVDACSPYKGRLCDGWGEHTCLSGSRGQQPHEPK